MHRLLAVAMGLGTLCACLDDDARPYEEFLADLDALGLGDTDDTDGPVDTDPPVDTDLPGPFDVLCSEDGGAPATVTFVNGGVTAADLYWVRSDCQAFNVALLAVGASSTQSTTVGHVFRLRDAFGAGFPWLDEVRVSASDDGQTVVLGY